MKRSAQIQLISILSLKLVFTFCLLNLSVNTLPLANAEGIPYDPTDDISKIFQSDCPSFNGAINSLANSQAAGISDVIQKLKNDTNCSAVQDVLSELTTIDLSRYDSTRDRKRLLTEIQDLEAALILEKSKPIGTPDADGVIPNGFRDPLYVNDITLTLIEKRRALLESKSWDQTNDYRQHYETIVRYQRLGEALFSALEVSPLCAQKYPNLGAQIGGQILATTSTLATGFMAPVLLAGSSIFDRFLKYVRNRGLNKNYQKIMNARLSQSVGCALEGLASTYCKARDLQVVAETSQPVCCTDWPGADIISKQMGAFNTWISKLSAGSSATSPGTAEDKKGAWDQESALGKLREDFNSSVALARQRLSQGADPASEAERLLIALGEKADSYLVSNSSPFSNSSSKGAILKNSFLEDLDCGVETYLYTNSLGKPVKKCNKGTQISESCLSCLKREFRDIKLSVEDLVVAQEKLIRDEAEAYVRAEKRLVKLSNPLSVLAAFNEDSTNNRTPREFVYNTRAYLEALLNDPQYSKGAEVLTIKNLKEKLDRTVCIIESLTDCPPSSQVASQSDNRINVSDVKPQDLVDSLYSELLPVNDIFFVADTLYGIVKRDLDRRIKNGDVIDENLKLILLLSQHDSLGEIVLAAMGRDPAIVQAQNAKEQTKENLNVLVDLFGEHVFNTIKGASDANIQAQACIRSLLAPTAPKLKGQDITALCRGKVWRSMHSDRSLDLKFDDLLKESSFEKRVCSIYDFYRKSRLKEF